MEKKSNSKIEKALKIFLLIVIIGILIVETIWLFPVIQKLNTVEGQMEFKQLLQESKISGFFILLGLEMIQIMIPILPGEPIELLAGICFGGLYGTLFIMAGAFITTLIIYYLVKKFGKKFIYQFVEKEKIDKVENSKIFKNEKRIELILIILFLIPATPKDLLVYIGGLLPIKSSRFIAIATLLRLPSIVSSTIAGQYIIAGNWYVVIGAYIATVLIAVLVLALVYVFDKNKVIKDAVKDMK